MRACLTKGMAALAQGAALWVFFAPYSRGAVVPLSSVPAPWNPFEAFEGQPITAWVIVAVRISGDSTVQAVMEEVRTSTIPVGQRGLRSIGVRRNFLVRRERHHTLCCAG